MSITKENKKKIVEEFSKNKNDTGSTSIQIAVISERINNLTQHFNNHKHDNHSRKGLLALVNKRKKLLNYLLKKDESKYLEITKKLKIRG